MNALYDNVSMFCEYSIPKFTYCFTAQDASGFSKKGCIKDNINDQI